MDGETTSRIDETASVASRLETTENAVFSRDQSQGEDWEAYCKELEAKNRDLQTRNDALQRVIERCKISPQTEDQGILSRENPDDNHQGSVARIQVDALRREFVAMKKRLDDTEALEQHFRQKFEHQQEADLLSAAELDRAKRDLTMTEEKRAEMERQWLEISQEKMRVDLDLRKLRLEVVGITRSRDESVKQLDVTVKELRQTSAKLEQAEALLNARGGEDLTVGNSLELRAVGNGGGINGDVVRERCVTWDGDMQHFVQQTVEENQALREENQSLLETVRCYEEKLNRYGGEHDDRRNDDIASRLTPVIRSSGTDDPYMRLGALRHEDEVARAELDQAIKAANENKRRYRECADLLNAEKSATSKQRRAIEEQKNELIYLERAKGEAERRWINISQENDHLKFRLQKIEKELASMEMLKNDIAGQFNSAQRVAEKASTKLVQKEALLKSRTAALRAAERFTQPHDDVAREDIVAIVREMNMKLYDVAHTVSVVVQVRAGVRPLPPIGVSKMNYLGNVIGPSLLRYLKEKKDHSKDPTLIQLTIQAALVTLVHQFCTTWPIPYDGQLGKPLWSIYERIRVHESPVVASRWRALSTKHYRGQYPGEYDLVTATNDRAIDVMSTILLVAGGEQKEKVDEAIRRSARNALEQLWKLANNFCEKVKEHVSSTDYQLFYIEPSFLYDERIMRNISSEKAPRQGNSSSDLPKVLCTVELGLRSSANPTKPGEQNDGRLEEMIMEKAVVLFKPQQQENSV